MALLRVNDVVALITYAPGFMLSPAPQAVKSLAAAGGAVTFSILSLVRQPTRRGLVLAAVEFQEHLGNSRAGAANAEGH